MAANPSYLITGPSRGIGYGLLKAYLARPAITVIAGVRNLEKSEKILKDLPIDSCSAIDAKSAVQRLQSEFGIQKLDVVISNAGLGHSWEKVLNTSIDSLRKYTEVNTIGSLVLFQSVYPLLEAAEQPKFIVMATAVSSFALMEHMPLPSAGYGASKAGVNCITRKIHFEHSKVTPVSLYSGWVKRELGHAIAKSIGMQEAEITINESVKGVLTRVDAASRDGTSGKFIDYKGKDVPW